MMEEDRDAIVAEAERRRAQGIEGDALGGFGGFWLRGLGRTLVVF